MSIEGTRNAEATKSAPGLAYDAEFMVGEGETEKREDGEEKNVIARLDSGIAVTDVGEEGAGPSGDNDNLDGGFWAWAAVASA